jgi:hypothetical protein
MLDIVNNVTKNKRFQSWTKNFKDMKVSSWLPAYPANIEYQ